MKASPHPHRVLFVCLGNICRSPAAEIIFHQLASDAGRGSEFEVDSAGTIGNHRGSPPDSRMVDALKRKGYNIHGQSRKIEAADLKKFGLIITMDESNFSDVLRLDPSGSLHEKIRPFVSYCRHHNVQRVPDPYYGGQRGFHDVIELLEDGCQGILETLPAR